MSPTKAFTCQASAVPLTYRCVARCEKCTVAYPAALQGDVNDVLDQGVETESSGSNTGCDFYFVLLIWRGGSHLFRLALNSVAWEVLSLQYSHLGLQNS